MNSVKLNKQIRKAMSAWLAVMLTVGLLLGSFPIAAFGAGEELTYRFTDAGFAGRPKQDGWQILGVLPGVPNTRWQSYGAQIQSTALNQFREFQFHVPETGYYTLQLSGFRATAGGTAAILVDNAKVGEYLFYSSLNGYGPKETLKTVQLTQGNHILKVQVIKRGASSFAMYPSEFTLISKDGPALISSVSVQSQTGTNEMVIGQQSALVVHAGLDDGTVPGPGEFQLSFESSDPTVISAGNRTVTALRSGTSVITVSASKDGSSKQAQLPLTVLAGQLETISFSLEKPMPVVGQTSATTLTGVLDDGTPFNMNGAIKTYSSENPAVALINAAGVVQAVSPGTTTVHVTAKLGTVTKTASASVTVVPKALESVELFVEPTILMLGMHGKVTVKGTMNDGTVANLTGAAITYRSSAENVLGVSATGELRALELGTSVLSAQVTLGTVSKMGELSVEIVPVQNDKTRSTFYTSQEVAAARENIGLYNWASSQRDIAVAQADKYVEKGLDFLWNSVTPQSLPRSYQTNQTLGNLSPLYAVPPAENPLNKLGNYPWQADPLNEPWKLTDPTSGYKFPTNDFGAYYRSGLDEHGVFDPSKADRSLLVNTLYPEKGPSWGVDDGLGWVDPETGYRYTFIAYYTHWYGWYSGISIVQGGLGALTNAYLYTGDPKYAQAGTVLLDRVADLYPAMDVSKYSPSVYLNSHGGTGLGKAVGSIWETGLIRTLIGAYDAFFPGMNDPVILDFLKEKGKQYDLPLKSSVAGIRKNMEDGILRQTFEGFKTAKIRGNNGYHQSSLAMAAVVLDKNPETKEWLDYVFQAGAFLRNPDRITGGNILNILVNDVDRDGNGNEAGPGYNSSWLSTYIQVADMLEGYDLYPAADLYQNVKFQKMFHGIYPLTMVERYTVQVGDSGSTGNPGTYNSKIMAVKAFQKYGDPIFAQIAYMLNHNSVDGIHGDIYTRNPNQIAQQIEAIIAVHGPFKLDSANLTGYGLAALRDGDNPIFKYSRTYSFPQLNVVESTKPTTYVDSSGTLQFEAAEAGDSITFSFDVAEPNRYEISLKAWAATSYGQYAIRLDGAPLTVFDFFGSGAEHRVIGELALTADTHTITFEAVGKNVESTGIKMGVIELALVDEAEQALRDASLEENTLRDVWMYYGRNGGHGHRDTLNLGMHAFGLDLMPELGYPEQANDTDAHRHEWVNNVISHNTVLVDKRKPAVQIVGQPKQFDDSDVVKVIDVEAPNLYPQTDLYKRTTAMIKVDDANSYAVDFFRIEGGNEHHFSFHGAEGAVTTEGLNLTTQAAGTYAGANVLFGVRPSNDSTAGSGYTGPGFHWLGNVERDQAPADQFSVDYDIVDTWNVLKQPEDIHLRLTMLGSVDDVALADGVPPRNKPGNPDDLRYVIAHRSGENISSLFTSVIEPYKGERFVSSISPAAVKANGVPVEEDGLAVRAVKVELTNGRTDYIVSALDPTIAYTVDDKIAFKGTLGVYTEQDGQQVYGYVNDGTEIGKIDGSSVKAGISGGLAGTIIDFTKELSLSNSLTVQMDLQGVEASDLIGRFVYADNDGTRNAAYQIKGVQSLGGNQYRLDIGDITLVRAYIDQNDFSKGFYYDVAAGASFRIPLSVEEALPVTKASVEGEQTNGWYTKGAKVSLNVTLNPASVLRTEYSLDGGTAWIPYSTSVELNESRTYKIQYRSVNLNGVAEETKSLQIGVDRLPPVTEAAVLGTGGADGWYVSGVSITLQASDLHSGVASTEYALALLQAPNSQAATVTGSTYGGAAGTVVPTNGFVPYTGAISLGEGVYELSYRSTDADGQVEETRKMTVKVDTTAPVHALQLNGAPVTDGMSISDAELVTLTLQANDALSGVSAQTILVDGMHYSAGSASDWAGKLGTHLISVTVSDAAGNQVSASYTITVTTSIDSLLRLADRFEQEGRLNGPLAPQIRNGLDQAKHQAETGHTVQAVKHLNDVLKHLNNGSMQAHLTAEAKTALETDIQALQQIWGNK